MTSGSKKKKSSSELPIRSQGLASSSFSLSLHYDHGHNDKNKNTISLRKVVAGIGAIVLLGAASYLQIQTGISNIINERPFAGLKEAAFWLRDNMRNDHDGVMTISHGSAQYILSLYANLDSYPFGKFRLHTILPGGATVKGAPAPEPLIQDGTVSYLVYYTPSRLASGDDPIHNPGTPNSAKFINLIHKYQSPLRHIVYDEYTGLDGKTVREPRVWIYEVGKRLPSSSVESHIERGSLKVSGAGFLIDSYVNFYYGRNQIETIPTDNNGAFSTSIKVPVCGLQLVVFDEEGNRSPVPMSFCAKR